MRIEPGLLQAGPLPHAELVLLVDHDQAELGELDVLLHDGLRADDQVELAGGDLGERLAALGRRQRSGQQPPADAAGGEELLDRGGMLPGQDFGRGHQRRLLAVRNRQQHRVHGHDGLAAAHVPLHQPIHRVRPGHVGRDFGDHLVLPGGQLEGKQAADAGVDLGRRLERRSLPQIVLRVALDRQGQLHDQQLLIDEAPPGTREDFAARRRMNLLDRLANRRQIVRRQDTRPERLRPGARPSDSTTAAHDAAHLALAHPFGQRIDRQQLAARIGVVSFQIFQVGVHHLPDAAAKAHLARQQQFLADRQPLGP